MLNCKTICQHAASLFAFALFLLTWKPVALWAAPLSKEPGRAFYQLYVRAFYDGSLAPDGEGDFSGMTAKLDYLTDLGIDTLLLMPVFASTGDMGYIPRDYFRLEPAYGDEASFRNFVTAAHARGIKIILDAPVNHISYDSAWFRRGSQKNCDPNDIAHDPEDQGNRYCDFFYFEMDPCHTLPYSNWHKPWLYSTTNCHAVWFDRPDYDPAFHRPEQVYATFFSVMPDLKFWDFEHNRWNEPVVAEVKRFFAHWAGTGVDGFRIDAAKHFVEGYANNSNPQEPRNKELLTALLTSVRTTNPDASFLGEIWSSYEEFEPYLPTSLDMVLDFPFMEALRSSVEGNYGEGFKGVLSHLEATQNSIKPGSRVVFAGNHDVSRLMTAWNDNEQKWRLAEFLALATPHTPLIYYGEEIGMHGKVKRPDSTSQEEYVRTVNAFPWNGRDESGGFPGGVMPISGISDNYRERNLEEARADAQSTFNMIRTMLRLRREFQVTPETKLTVRQDLYGHVIGWTLSKPKPDGRLSCRSIMVNFNDTDTYVVSAKHAVSGCGSAFRDVLSEQAIRSNDNAAVRYSLQPYGKVVFDD